MLELWSPAPNDGKRAARLAIGGVVGLGVFGLGASIAAGSAISAPAPAPIEEEPVVEVALVETPEELPEPEPVVHSPEPRPGPRSPPPTPQVTKVPDGAKEADATYGDGGRPSVQSTGTGHGNGTGPSIQAPPPPPPPPPPAPKPKAPSKITEDIDPPRCSFGRPSHPPGVDVEGTVAVKFVVGDDGSIREVKVVRGPLELHAAAIAAVRAGRCTPARRKDDGSIVSVSKVQPFRFRLQ